jgi:hypothetical protein
MNSLNIFGIGPGFFLCEDESKAFELPANEEALLQVPSKVCGLKPLQ